MKYTSSVKLQDIQQHYDHIIAWGGGSLLFLYYQPSFFQAEFIIDGTGKNIGSAFRGAEIKEAKALENLSGKSLVVIYTIYEEQVLEQIKQCNQEVDTIVFPLLKSDAESFISYAKNCEDVLLCQAIKYLGITNLTYLEIGVCHPIMRNNTYPLREYIEAQGGECRGVLAEANPSWWKLIEEYRPNDELLKCGVGDKEDKRTLYIFPNLLGHTTFIKPLSGNKYREELISIMNINDILKNSFDSAPDILAIDAEGMDFTVLSAWDHIIYPIKIIVAEFAADDENITSILEEKGYSLYARTIENGIWIRNDYMVNKLLPMM